MDAAAIDDLGEAVVARLEASGVLGPLRAELQGAVAATLRAGDGAPPAPRPAPPPTARLINALIRDYLSLTGLEHTLGAFVAETGDAGTASDRLVAAHELGAGPGASSSLPLLYSLVSVARAARLAASEATSLAPPTSVPVWPPPGPGPWGAPPPTRVTKRASG